MIEDTTLRMLSSPQPSVARVQSTHGKQCTTLLVVVRQRHLGAADGM